MPSSGNDERATSVGPPTMVAALSQLRTTSATTALGFVGQFDQCIFGIRLGGEIMISGEANDTFERNQIAILPCASRRLRHPERGCIKPVVR